MLGNLYKKKTTQYVAIAFLFASLFWMGAPGHAWATNAGDVVNLPDPALFKPPVGEAATSMTGFIKLFNYLIALFGVFLMFYGVYQSMKSAKDLLSGKAWKQIVSEKFVGLGIGFVILLIGITGVWYDILLFLGKILQMAFKMFNAGL